MGRGIKLNERCLAIHRVRREITMRVFIRNICSICLLSILIHSSYSQAEPYTLTIAPYLGADAQIRYINWGNGGNSIFKKNYIQGNFYGGLEFCDYVGMEAGYETTVPRTVYNNISGGQFLGRSTVGLTGPLTTQGKFEISGWHGSLVGFIPLMCPETNFYLSVGMAYLTAKHWATILSDSNDAIQLTSNLFRNSTKKAVLRAGGGFEYIFVPCIGLRLSVDWENTARFKNIQNDYVTDPSRVSLKNSWIYGVGLFTKF